MKNVAARLTGQRFGTLTVESRSPANTNAGHARWICRCDCGGTTVASTGNLRSGNTKSCGCLAKLVASYGNRVHGGRRSLAYSSWTNAVQRCSNPNSPSWAEWGGRGITMCARWRESFAEFLADMGERPVGTTIDRIDNDRGYSCGKCDDCLTRGETPNCRWATWDVQNNNRRPRRTEPRP